MDESDVWSLSAEAMDGLAMSSLFFFFFFFLKPPFGEWNHSSAGWKDIWFLAPISSFCVFNFSAMCWDSDTDWTAPTILKPRWRRPRRFWHPTGPKWFEPSDRLFHPQGRQRPQLRAKRKVKKKKKKLQIFDSRYGWTLEWKIYKQPNDLKKTTTKKQTSTNRSMWTGFLKVALFWMVLLPLTCDHHLSVSCSALETPASLGAISSIYHQVVLLNCSTPSFPPTIPLLPAPQHAHLVTFFLNCLPSVTLSVTSPVILPCAYKLWLFCAEMRQTGGSLLPRSPLP